MNPASCKKYYILFNLLLAGIKEFMPFPRVLVNIIGWQHFDSVYYYVADKQVSPYLTRAPYIYIYIYIYICVCVCVCV